MNLQSKFSWNGFKLAIFVSGIKSTCLTYIGPLIVNIKIIRSIYKQLYTPQNNKNIIKIITYLQIKITYLKTLIIKTNCMQ